LLAEIRRERRVSYLWKVFANDDLRRWKQGNQIAEKRFWSVVGCPQLRHVMPGARLKRRLMLENGKTYIDPYAVPMGRLHNLNENKHYLWPISTFEISQNPI